MSRTWNRLVARAYARFPFLSRWAARRLPGDSVAKLPWAAPVGARNVVPLRRATIALVTLAGVHLKTQPPFDMQHPDGDASFPVIPAGGFRRPDHHARLLGSHRRRPRCERHLSDCAATRACRRRMDRPGGTAPYRRDGSHPGSGNSAACGGDGAGDRGAAAGGWGGLRRPRPRLNHLSSVRWTDRAENRAGRDADRGRGRHP